MTESIARLGVAHVPDGRGTFMELTVEENFRLAPIRGETPMWRQISRACGNGSRA